MATRRDFLKKASAGMASLPYLSSAQKFSVSGKPRGNLLFILVDQLRFDALSCMGNDVIETPNIDSLAASGVLFDKAYTACAVSVPARASLLTGCSIHRTGIAGNGICYESKGELTGTENIYNMLSYDEVLMRNGYHGEYFGKWHSPEFRAYAYNNRPVGCAGMTNHSELGTGLGKIYTDWLTAVAPPAEQKDGDVYYKPVTRYYAPDPFDPMFYGNTEPKGEAYVVGELRVSKEHTRTAMDSKFVIDSINRCAGNPFTIHCSYGPPHPPFLVCPEYRGQLSPDDVEMVPNFDARESVSPYIVRIGRETYFQNPDTLKYLIRNYWLMVKELDDWVGEVIAALRTNNLLDDTMIVFTADHGEMLGAHGMSGKSTFYEESARVPLIVSYPGRIPAGQVVNAPVNTPALYATILDYLNVTGATHTPDQPSLRRYIENPSPELLVDAFGFSEWNTDSMPGEMIRTADWKLMCGRVVKSNNCVDALYDMKNDPLETTNLLFASNYQDYLPIAEQLRARLVSHLRSIDSPYADGVEARVFTTAKK